MLFTPPMDLSKFNKEQIQAITFGDGPLLIIAGAGTGKTTVITERIKYLILEKGVKPQEILALTFTEKASAEMEERIDKIMPYGYTQMWIETFHSFCDLILKEETINIGMNPNYKLMTETDSVLFLRKNIFDLNLSYYKPLGNPTKFLEALLEHFSRLKDEDITPENYLKFANEESLKLKNKNLPEEEKIEIEKILELTNAYKKYEELKVKEGMMDFSDLISNTLLLLRTRKNILKKYQNQFKYVLVDEFQDTNYAQNELAILLAGNNKNITVVADDDQAIYRWRGAALSNVLQFKKNFEGAQIITLTKNYRSTQEILDRSYKLIQHNNPNRLEMIEGINKKLTAERKIKGDKIELIHTERSEEEAESIAKKILSLTGSKGKYDFKDISILTRANNHAQPITAALQRFKIPYQFLGPGQLFHQEEIKDLIAYLKVLYNIEDSVSLFRLLNMEIFDIQPKDINYLLNFSKKRNLTLFETLGKLDEIFLSDESKEKITNIQKMILRHLERVKKDTAGQILYYFLVDTGLFQKLTKYDTAKEEKIAQNVAKFFDKLKSFEYNNEDSSIYAIVDWIDLMMQVGESPLAANTDWREYNAVNILTVHSSKGLEFPVVFLINLVSNRFPSTERREKIPLSPKIIKEVLLDEDYHLQEERRLFYVGMTRARDQLFFTASRFYGEGKRERKLSNFITETLSEQEIKKKEEIKNVKQLSLIDIKKDYEKKDEAEKIVKPPLKLDFISFSQLQAFDICPLHFKARYIDRIPTEPNSSLSFGTTIHNALKDFYKQIKLGEKVKQSDLTEIIKRNWLADGYQSKFHEKEALIKAEEIMKNYYQNYFNPKIIPQELEMSFSFHLENGPKVIGKIDRIDLLEDGTIEIIDYKTGAFDSSFKNSYQMQLGIYGLAATRVKHPIFGKKPEDIKLTLFYVETGNKQTFTVTENELKNIEEKVKEKIKEIETSDFSCSKHPLCIDCEYKMLCNTHL